MEDLLLQHEELTNPSLFEVNEKFIPPHISAPPVHKEMLYSLLQKNFQKDLSSFNFEFKDTFWEITNNSAEYQCESFEEIIILIENI